VQLATGTWQGLLYSDVDFLEFHLILPEPDSAMFCACFWCKFRGCDFHTLKYVLKYSRILGGPSYSRHNMLL
jgi:hypothetical protein